MGVEAGFALGRKQSDVRITAITDATGTVDDFDVVKVKIGSVASDGDIHGDESGAGNGIEKAVTGVGPGTVDFNSAISEPAGLFYSYRSESLIELGCLARGLFLSRLGGRLSFLLLLIAADEERYE